jgi:hypothetical protein
MVQGTPYVHWKIKDAVDFSEIDPVYLWGTVIESNKGPINTPVFCTNADQVKKIFNYDLRPFFANGGRSVVIVRAYAGKPETAKFNFELDQAFKYVYVDYDYYDENDDTSIKAKILVMKDTLETERPKAYEVKYNLLQEDTEASIPKTVEECNVRFYQGRWRICDKNGNIQHYYWSSDSPAEKKVAVVDKDENGDPIAYYPEGTTLPAPASVTPILEQNIFMQSFNESDVTKITIAKIEEIQEGSSLVHLETVYPGDYTIPVTISKHIKQGYRISVKESDDYTILLSGVTTLSNITKRINERASNVTAKITDDGNKIEKVFNTTLIPVKDSAGETILPNIDEPNAINEYTKYVHQYESPVGAIFAKVPKDADDPEDFNFVLVETATYLADGSNGIWNKTLHRIADPSSLQNRKLIATAHKDALDLLSKIKLSGIFCNYGEDEVQRVYANHVSTTEPEGMNSAEVCKWRTLIVGANAFDRTNEVGNEIGYNLFDKAISYDNENILFLGQGLIDTGYTPESTLMKSEDGKYVSLLAEDEGALPGQLLPFQCTQYIAGLRSKLFYGDAIFGGESKKEIRGIGQTSIAPLFAGENKVLWQPGNYTKLNEYGVLTFTDDYNVPIALMDGVTTRQSPLEEDEEGVQSIVKYAKHAIHEELQTFIGRNLTGDLQVIMENSVRNILNGMQTQDQTLQSIPDENILAYDVEIVLVPKTNAQQLLAKAYVYLKLTPVHALRQIEVELTVQ